MKMNRREFLKTGAAVLGAAAVTEGLTTALNQKGSVAEAAGPAPQPA